jgi:FkbM family methyltransferase
MWRTTLARGLTRLPAPLRRRVWSARRERARRRRRALEARGDFSRSRPALYDMDAKLEQYLGFDGGFFVEAGANDGYDQSNTYYLERVRGWRGLLVEPVPFLLREAVRERPRSRVVGCALVAPDYTEPTVRLRYGGLMTTLAGARGSEEADRAWVQPAHAFVQEEPEHELVAPARTLSSLLDEAGAPPVDLLSLDVEGFEPQVLAGLDLDRHAPRFMLIEVGGVEDRRAQVEAVLGDRYEPVVELSEFDVLYRRRAYGL